ncbi:hypothetical protein OEIGOIKO_00419 [Streptomyces chrestomyceticus JCM 4735]|uniref:Integral membrane protein n=1 Tax=Streptomyces chrestomyceticus JCM 4735 TaxID=1306181 RepID=A0A7U9KQ10_9ACTN|nr:DUF6114 domain-containing protein [Streptomyces chrestomyceticus]GCD32702.1 hypothetical protein OEIGOIKO_00419 [Streptomyces chrestomyceticus JCM 4735]
MLLTTRRPAARLPWPERRAAFRGWRRTRPFWAGLLLILGGAELLLVPLSPLTVLISLGLGGLAAIGIGLALIVAGLFLWLRPAAHHYVSLHALILSVLSFAATNLGGFLLGMGLGIAGSAMGFGWTPLREEAEGDEEGDGDERTTPPLSQKDEDTSGKDDKGRSKTLAVTLPIVLIAVIGTPTEPAHAAPGIPAPPVPPTVTTTMFAPKGFLLAGVTEVQTADGPVKAMVLRMKAASLTDYRLTTRDAGGPQLRLGARSLDLSGNVTLYLTKFSGCLEGLICLTFTPDTLPVPPVVPPFVFMTDVDAEQALVTSDLIVADGLALDAGPGAGTA